jgi:hypothetical protein
MAHSRERESRDRGPSRTISQGVLPDATKTGGKAPAAGSAERSLEKRELAEKEAEERKTRAIREFLNSRTAEEVLKAQTLAEGSRFIVKQYERCLR